ncbi:MAG: hypothetical protein ACYTKD_26405 [Planctomycetota bacterium]|jgi:hypothetical protein
MNEIKGVQTVERLMKEIEKAKSACTEERVKWLFRGQSRPYARGWELLPRAYRKSTWTADANHSALALDLYSRRAELHMFKEFR